jgi:hypothetical protein
MEEKQIDTRWTFADAISEDQRRRLYAMLGEDKTLEHQKTK